MPLNLKIFVQALLELFRIFSSVNYPWFRQLFEFSQVVLAFLYIYIYIFSVNILFFNSLIFFSTANAFPALIAVENISTLYFLFKSNIFFCLNSRSVCSLAFQLLLLFSTSLQKDFIFATINFLDFMGKHKLWRWKDWKTRDITSDL